MPQPSLLPLLYRALRSPFGIAVRTNDPARLRTRFYVERRKAMETDPQLKGVSFVGSYDDPENEAWFARNGSEAEAQPQPQAEEAPDGEEV